MSTRSSPGSSATPERARAFAPVAGPRTRLLILGSLPGAASLRAGQYYAHPQNGFWRLIGAATGRELAALPYPDRLAALAAAGIGLWDVVASAERPGQRRRGDPRPRARRPRRPWSRACPSLRAVAFNGATAARLGRRRLGGARGAGAGRPAVVEPGLRGDALRREARALGAAGCRLVSRRRRPRSGSRRRAHNRRMALHRRQT